MSAMPSKYEISCLVMAFHAVNLDAKPETRRHGRSHTRQLNDSRPRANRRTAQGEHH